MCGRVYARLNRTDLAAVYALPSENIGHSIATVNNAGPGCTNLPVLTRDNTIQPMTFGLIPVYQKKDEKLNFFQMFNARSETMYESPVFGRIIKISNVVY